MITGFSPKSEKVISRREFLIRILSEGYLGPKSSAWETVYLRFSPSKGLRYLCYCKTFVQKDQTYIKLAKNCSVVTEKQINPDAYNYIYITLITVIAKTFCYFLFFKNHLAIFILLECNKVSPENQEVANIFNDYFDM